MNKLTLLFLFILITSSCSTINHQSDRNINSVEILHQINRCAKDSSLYKNSDYINSINNLCNSELTDSTKISFNDLLAEIDDVANIQNFLNNSSLPEYNLATELIVIEVQFRLLVALQHNLVRIYSELPPGLKFENTIIFASTNTNLSEIKTSILNRQFEIYRHLMDGISKNRCLLALKRMLLEIDINRTVDKIVQRSPFGLMMAKNKILLKFNEIIANENNPSLKKNIEDTRDYILSNCDDYKDLTGNIIVENLSNLGTRSQINKEAVKLFNSAAEINDPIERIQTYSDAIKLDSNFIAAFNNRGISFFDINDFTSASNDFQTVIEMDPAFTSAYSALGNCRMKLNKYSSAIEYYNLAIESGEYTYSNYNNRGLCFYKMDQYQEAWTDFNSAIQLDSLSVSAYANRAICSLVLKDFQWAKKDYQKLIELEPKKSKHYYNLGCVYYKLNEPEQVYRIWSKGLEVNSRDSLILKNIKTIESQIRYRK